MHGTFTLALDDRTGETVCAASGPVPAAALSALATALVRASLPPDDAGSEAGSRSTGFRAMAPTLDALVGAVAREVAAIVEEDCGRVSDARVDGVLQTDDGWSAWGYATLSDASVPGQAAIDVRDATLVDRGRVTLVRATLAPRARV